ncbi:MAG: hypothetical protein JO149_06770, partial [Gammaproteobacteria bacterium]|nr:hypothetical protein [Gammaproteobacteria bacterium]
KKAMKEHVGLNKQHQKLSNALEQLLEKQTKLLALGKYLKQFDKEWVKNSKNVTKVKSQRKKAKSSAETTSSIQEQPQTVASQDILVENVRLPEATEELVS